MRAKGVAPQPRCTSKAPTDPIPNPESESDPVPKPDPVLLEDGGIYSDLIEASLSAAARKALEMLLPNYQFQTPAFRKSYEKGRAEGQALGQAGDILEILDARGLSISEEQRQRVLTCTDLETLKSWVRKAVTVSATDDLFNT